MALALPGDLERRGEESAAINNGSGIRARNVSSSSAAANQASGVGAGIISLQKPRKVSCYLNLDEID